MKVRKGGGLKGGGGRKRVERERYQVCVCERNAKRVEERDQRE